MKKTLIIAAAVIGLVSCSKEKKLESRLDNQEWNIDQFKYEEFRNGQQITGQTCTKENAGFFKMEKNGIGTADWQECGVSRTYTITKWTTGIDSLKLEMTDNVTQGKEVFNFSVLTNEKKKQVWKMIIQVNGPLGITERHSTYTLSRKK